MFLQRTIGNQAVQRMIKSGMLPAKLKIAQSESMYDEEAGWVTGQIVDMPKQQLEQSETISQNTTLAEQNAPLAQRKSKNTDSIPPVTRPRDSSSVAHISHVSDSIIQKDEDDNSWLSNWRFQFGIGPMKAPSIDGPAADFYPPTPQLPLPGFLLNRGLGFQYSKGEFDFGVFPNLGGNTDFYGTKDMPRLLNSNSSSKSKPPIPPLLFPEQVPPFSLNMPESSTIAPDMSIMPPVSSSHGLRKRTIDRFEHNQSSLPSQAMEQLISIASWIKLANPSIVWVIGHADKSGEEQLNQALSEARAVVVRQVLIDLGVDASIIESSGEGELNLLIPDAGTPDQHARNRRVTIEWADPIPDASDFQLRPPSLMEH